jgi:glycosyltransferase involved in cell wall biosynthesis
MISACVIAYNEENNIKRLIESLSDCDEIIIADGGSTDKTVELAKELGANVYVREDKLSIPTKKEIDEFTKEFGYAPKFTQESKIRHAANIRNDVVKKSKNDWILFPDADEFVSWNFEEIKDMTTKCDSIECKLVQTRDGKHFNYITKLYNKTKTSWAGRIHEAVLKGPK